MADAADKESKFSVTLDLERWLKKLPRDVFEQAANIFDRVRGTKNKKRPEDMTDSEFEQFKNERTD